MADGAPNGPRRTLPVDPVIRVETFATHRTLTWKAGGLSRFIEAVRGVETVAPAASTVVEDAAVAGRHRSRFSQVDADRDTTKYLRVEPEAPWTLSWERRTWPVVSVSGAPPAPLCRRLHLRTTDCPGWDDRAFETLRRLTSDSNDETP
jgi:hypothetical protein